MKHHQTSIMLGCVLAILTACEPDAPDTVDPSERKIVLPVHSDEFVLLGQYGTVSTAWVIPKAEARSLPRWSPGQNPPLSNDDALRIARGSGKYPEESRLIRIGFQNSNEERDDPDFQDLFYHVIDFLVPDGRDEDYRTIVVLPDGRVLEGRRSE
jgi:hypothetical protein